MAAHRIRTAGAQPWRWKEGDEITASKHLVLQPHTAALAGGKSLLDLGCFSYTLSLLSPMIAVGRYCSISWNVRIMGPQHPTSFLSTSEILYKSDTMFRQSIRDFGHEWQYLDYDPVAAGPPRIGNDVWIGQDVVLGPRARLGDGCVVAACAVVTGDVPPYAIVGGVPARIIRFRFPSDLITELLRSRWWDYALPDLHHLPLSSPQAFLPEFERSVASGELKPYAPDLGLAYDVIQRLL